MHEVQTIEVAPEAAKQRLDQYLTTQLDGVSRSRVQMLMDQGDVLVNGEREKASFRLRGGETILITGEPRPAPLKAIAEDIPLDVIYEDSDLAVINKPAGMMVHAGSGQNEDARNRGTLVNALLHRFKKLSATGGDLRPGIVHRLDKDTSGLIVVAKNDRTHAALGEMFSSREMKKTYIALVQGIVVKEKGTINAEVGRDPQRRTRMKVNPLENGRSAISHYEVMQRITSRFGRFTLVKVRIETGRTHQIRVHMALLGHPVVGDSLYGGPGQLTDQIVAQAHSRVEPDRMRLGRNFLHAAHLEFVHPRNGKVMALDAPLPVELTDFLASVDPSASATPSAAPARPVQVVASAKQSWAAKSSIKRKVSAPATSEAKAAKGTAPAKSKSKAVKSAAPAKKSVVAKKTVKAVPPVTSKAKAVVKVAKPAKAVKKLATAKAPAVRRTKAVPAKSVATAKRSATAKSSVKAKVSVSAKSKSKAVKSAVPAKKSTVTKKSAAAKKSAMAKKSIKAVLPTRSKAKVALKVAKLTKAQAKSVAVKASPTRRTKAAPAKSVASAKRGVIAKGSLKAKASLPAKGKLKVARTSAPAKKSTVVKKSVPPKKSLTAKKSVKAVTSAKSKVKAQVAKPAKAGPKSASSKVKPAPSTKAATTKRK